MPTLNKRIASFEHKARQRIKSIIERFPSLSLFVFASVISGITMSLALHDIFPAGLFIAMFGPSLAGIILTSIAGGKTGLKELFRRLLIWRVGIQWWIFVLLFLAPATLGARYLYYFFGGPALDLSSIRPLYEAIPGLIILTITSGFAEELGWRGFLLPRLQSRYSALLSTIIVTAAWGLWHWPLFIYDIEGLPYFAMKEAIGFVPALLGFTAIYLLAWSIQFTWVFNNTKGSLLLISVLHASQVWVGFLMDIDKPVNFIPLTVMMTVTSIIIVLVFGGGNLSRSNKKQIFESS